MGLDVYVGSLTRYCAHDWETIVQEAGRSLGIPVEVVNASPPPDEEIKDPAQIQDRVVAWRSNLEVSLKESQLMSTDLDWNEQSVTPYFTDKPDWDCFGAMTLLPAYEEQPKAVFGSRWPKELDKHWARDPKLAARLKATEPGPYSHIYGCVMWIPFALKNPINGSTPNGDPAMIGSTSALLEQLELLNLRTYRSAPDDLVEWRREMPEGGETRFEPKAKAGLAIFLNLTRLAVGHHLPMLLDY